MGAVATAAALVISALFTWFFGPFLTTQDLTEYSAPVFGTRVLPYAAWTPMQLFEAGWLLILSAVLIAGTIGLVRRRMA
jgi:hypothetical protein